MNPSRLASLAVLLLVPLAGCGTNTATQERAVPTSARTASVSPTSERTVSVAPTSERTVPTVPDELTAEAALGSNPPPPRNVRARVATAAVEVTWDDPPVVTVPHSYSDRVVAFRIYRTDPGETEARPIGVTSSHRYRDATARAGMAYGYAVSSVREHHVEGSRSEAGLVTVP